MGIREIYSHMHAQFGNVVKKRSLFYRKFKIFFHTHCNVTWFLQNFVKVTVSLYNKELIWQNMFMVCVWVNFSFPHVVKRDHNFYGKMENSVKLTEIVLHDIIFFTWRRPIIFKVLLLSLERYDEMSRVVWFHGFFQRFVSKLTVYW